MKLADWERHRAACIHEHVHAHTETSLTEEEEAQALEEACLVFNKMNLFFQLFF